MTKNGDTLKYRVAQLEKCSEKVEERLDSIMENHIPHLNEQVSSLKTRIEVLTVVNIGAVILALIINKYL